MGHCHECIFVQGPLPGRVQPESSEKEAPRGVEGLGGFERHAQIHETGENP